MTFTAAFSQELRLIVSDKPFKVEKIGSVYVIFSVPVEKKERKTTLCKTYVISGELADKLTGESLPYAYIHTNKGIISTDGIGHTHNSHEGNKHY